MSLANELTQFLTVHRLYRLTSVVKTMHGHASSVGGGGGGGELSTMINDLSMTRVHLILQLLTQA